MYKFYFWENNKVVLTKIVPSENFNRAHREYKGYAKGLGLYLTYSMPYEG